MHFVMCRYTTLQLVYLVCPLFPQEQKLLEMPVFGLALPSQGLRQLTKTLTNYIEPEVWLWLTIQSSMMPERSSPIF